MSEKIFPPNERSLLSALFNIEKLTWSRGDFLRFLENLRREKNCSHSGSNFLFLFIQFRLKRCQEIFSITRGTKEKHRGVAVFCDSRGDHVTLFPHFHRSCAGNFLPKVCFQSSDGLAASALLISSWHVLKTTPNEPLAPDYDSSTREKEEEGENKSINPSVRERKATLSTEP
jgi:hypothetical protein